jgi:hypothetical protein
MSVCPCCGLTPDARCQRCEGVACRTCDRCCGCGRVVCVDCDTRTPGEKPFSFPGDRAPHPHNEGWL